MSLLDVIRARITETGPLSIAEYMAECLLNPRHGYYTTRDPLGAAGDFITAPEVSQMFGELVGLAMAQGWMDQGAPSRFTLAEFGPGRGTLMADALRATRGVPGFHAAMDLVLLEASPVLRGAQGKALAGFTPRWVERIDALPDQPLFLIANEFFDALPIRQFIREGRMWRERLVGLQDGALSFGLGGPVQPAALMDRLDETRDGDLVELCPSAAGVMGEVATRITAYGGAALIIDYGEWGSLGDTFQALEKHQKVDPLARPGMADLTAHVDFEALAGAASDLAHSRLAPQGMFLERLGITERAQSLAKGLTGAALDSHIAAHRRLTHPEEMGSLFKTIGFVPKGAPMLPGLEP